MIRVLLGDTHGALGFYELDETAPGAEAQITALGGKALIETLANVFMHMRGYGESDLETLRALPRRVRGYHWAKDISPPPQGHAPQVTQVTR